MSTIRALNAGAPGSGTTTDFMKGLAKAWLNYKGTATAVVRESFNVSSVTSTGTGQFTVNLAAAMASANYAAQPTGQSTSGTSTNLGVLLAAGTPLATSSAAILTGTPNTGGVADLPTVCVSILGDLA